MKANKKKKKEKSRKEIILKCLYFILREISIAIFRFLHGIWFASLIYITADVNRV